MIKAASMMPPLSIVSLSLAMVVVLPSAAQAGPTPAERFTHDSAIVEMRQRANVVADAYYDLAEAHAAGLPENQINEATAKFEQKLKDALLVHDVVGRPIVSHRSRAESVKRRRNYGTGLEASVLTGPFQKNPSLPYFLRGTLSAALGVGTTLALSAFAYDNPAIFLPALAGVAAGISSLVMTATGDNRSSVKAPWGHYSWRYQRHLLLSVFTGQLRRRGVTVSKDGGIVLPALASLHVSADYSDYYYSGEGVSATDETTYTRLLFDEQNLKPFMDAVSGLRGRLFFDQRHNGGLNTCRFIEMWKHTLATAESSASPTEAHVISALHSAWDDFSARDYVDEKALLQLLRETREASAAIPSLAQAMTSVSDYDFAPFRPYDAPVNRSEVEPLFVDGAITEDVFTPVSTEESQLVFKRGKIASKALTQALMGLIPPPPPAVSEVHGNYRENAPPANSSGDELNLATFANLVTFEVVKLQHRLAATAQRPGLHELSVQLTVHRRNGAGVVIPATITFNSTQPNDRVLRRESSWIAPLNEALLRAVNDLADARRTSVLVQECADELRDHVAADEAPERLHNPRLRR